MIYVSNHDWTHINSQARTFTVRLSPETNVKLCGLYWMEIIWIRSSEGVGSWFQTTKQPHFMEELLTSSFQRLVICEPVFGAVHTAGVHPGASERSPRPNCGPPSRQACPWARLSSRQRQTHMDTTSALPSLYCTMKE